MSERWRAIIELIERSSWDDLTSDDFALLHEFCCDVTPHDLFLFGLEIRIRAMRRPRKSSSQTLEAIQQQAADIRERETLPPEGEE